MPETATDPSVAVIVPVFNRRELLQATVASLRAQSLASAEFLLVDDRSTADTRRYLAGLPAVDRRFRVLEKPDDLPQGCQASKNFGLDACRAKTVMFLDSDDLAAPTCLAERVEFLRTNPTIELVVGRQAIFDEVTRFACWVNIARHGVSDLDRFLNLSNPLDVPWVNGGVMFRTDRLRAAGVRWRPEFAWDDVAFHFECLASGLQAGWMGRPATPDSWYRLHGGDHFGRTLHSPDGLANAAGMICWMARILRTKGLLSESRRRALARSHFHACVLRALDGGQTELAGQLSTDARCEGVLTAPETMCLRIYAKGRRRLHDSPRATWAWNRAFRRTLLREWFRDHPGADSYATVAIDFPEASSALQAMLHPQLTAV